jgi:regulator of RNase E activity RraA
MPPVGDAELFSSIRQSLYTAVVGDILDQMGHFDHFLPPQVRPLTPEMIVVGRATPVIVEDGHGTSENPFGKLLEALDSLKEGDVYITNGGASPYALWGELMSTRAKHLGVAGAVMNGYHRDTAGILALGFPTFSWGAWAKDLNFRGQVVDFNVPTRVGDVAVSPGDVVFADRDGVLIVPKQLAEEVFTAALEKVQSENLVREGLRKGMSAVEAFSKYGVI